MENQKDENNIQDRRKENKGYLHPQITKRCRGLKYFNNHQFGGCVVTYAGGIIIFQKTAVFKFARIVIKEDMERTTVEKGKGTTQHALSVEKEDIGRRIADSGTIMSRR